MIAFLIDADNLSAAAWIDEAFQTLERSEGPIAIRRAYGSAENIKGLADTLRTWAIRPFVNLPLPKNTTDMSLAVDAMELACLTPRPKLIVIGSGDLDFVPLVVRLRERGIKVLCVSERRKMATDAVSAYDDVIYVTGHPVGSSYLRKEADQILVEKKETLTPKKKVVSKTNALKTTTPKSMPAKKVAAKKVAKKSTVALTIDKILAAAPDLQAGQWIPLGNVVKILHDENLLGKNVASTKLFKKFPSHFELDPEKQPSRVRFIKKTK